jgi:2,3-dihydroxybenzoate decarboxylase
MAGLDPAIHDGPQDPSWMARVSALRAGPGMTGRNMLQSPNCPIVTLEDHYWDEELIARWERADLFGGPEIEKRLRDLDELRIGEMDEAGIDFQVLSHGAPATQRLAGADAVALARRVNDRLAAAVQKHPKRLGAFAVLPTSDPAAAADELARTVETHGFVGAMIHGLANGAFVDERRFWPIYARAEALDVPIYLHPALPHPAVKDAYYKDYAKDFPAFINAGWGFTVETATAALRLVLSGAFDAHPRLKVILGHLGETLPFLIWRVDHALARPGQKPVKFRETFSRHFYVTTSGFFSTPALQCCMLELGVDRILFSVDYPFVRHPPAVRWLESVPLNDEDKAKIASGNARRLLRLP